MGLLILLTVSYIYLALKGTAPYGRWISFLFQSTPGITLYMSLILNIICISIRTAYERLKIRKPTSESILNMDTHRSIAVSDSAELETIAGWIKSKGFSPVICDKDRLTAIKGRLSFLPGTLMRTGLIVLMVAILLSFYSRKTEEAMLTEGGNVLLLGKNIYLSSIKSSLPDEFLEFGGDISTFRLKDISLALVSSQKTYTVTSGLPSRADGFYFRVTHIGFLQPITVKLKTDEFKKDIYLDILPPGKTTETALPSGWMLKFALIPEKTIKKGLFTGKLFNLRSPLYSMTFVDVPDAPDAIDKPPALSVRASSITRFQSGDVLLGKPALSVKVQVVYDPALLWIYTGIVLTLSGMLLMFSRFFWYEKEICAVLMEDEVLIGYKEEFYKKWGIYRFHRWQLPDTPTFPH